MVDTADVETPALSIRHEGLARRLAWGATFMWAVPCVLGMAIPSRLEPIGSALLLLFGGAPVVAVAAAIARMVGLQRPARVRIEHGILRILYREKERSIPLADIVSGWFVPGAPSRVEWSLRDGRLIRAAVNGARDADALLSASGVDVRRRSFSMRLGTGPGLFALGALGFVVSICPSTIVASLLDRAYGHMELLRGSVWLAMVVAGIAGSIALFGPPRITIGTDGVSIQRLIGSRFVPYADIVSVTNDPLEIILVLNASKRGPVRIPVAELPLEQRRALFTRIEESRLAARVRVEPAASAEMLDRGGRSLAEWRSMLANLARGGDGYRLAALHRDDLVRVLIDPVAPAERRIGAAIALTVDGDSDAIERVRVTASACASAPVRVALTRVADDAFEAADLAAAVKPDERPERE